MGSRGITQQWTRRKASADARPYLKPIAFAYNDEELHRFHPSHRKVGDAGPGTGLNSGRARTKLRLGIVGGEERWPRFCVSRLVVVATAMLFAAVGQTIPSSEQPGRERERFELPQASSAQSAGPKIVLPSGVVPAGAFAIRLVLKRY
jgi:hypothetical protein